MLACTMPAVPHAHTTCASFVTLITVWGATHLASMPSNDACCRGAAYANGRQYSEAAHSFRHAIQIDPLSRNATQYLEAVVQRAAHEGVTISEVQTPAVEGHKQQGQGDDGPKGQKARHIPQSPTPAVAGRLEDPGKEHMGGLDHARTTGKRKAGATAGVHEVMMVTACMLAVGSAMDVKILTRFLFVIGTHSS